MVDRCGMPSPSRLTTTAWRARSPTASHDGRARCGPRSRLVDPVADQLRPLTEHRRVERTGLDAGVRRGTHEHRDVPMRRVSSRLTRSRCWATRSWVLPRTATAAARGLVVALRRILSAAGRHHACRSGVGLGGRQRFEALSGGVDAHNQRVGDRLPAGAVLSKAADQAGQVHINSGRASSQGRQDGQHVFGRRFDKGGPTASGLLGCLADGRGDDHGGQVDALIADEHARSCDELLYFGVRLGAERTRGDHILGAGCSC